MIVSFMKRSGPSAAKRRDERARTFLPVVLALVGFVTPNSDGLADLKLPPKPRGDPPMRIVRVTSSDPACQPNCPEWISAEGRIMPGSAKAFDKAIADLKGRRLPILISSHGGSLGDAMVMGFIIREKGLAVAVARTLIANCSERAPSCQNAKGEAAAAGASCASACPLVLAGGVERLVGPLPLVGVHEVTTLIKEVEGSEHLATVKKVYEQGPEDAAVHGYLTAMGIGEPVMALLRKTPAASIRWLSLGEIRQSRLATLALDAAQPIVTSGANGLNGHAFEGDPPAPDVVKARVAEPLATSAGGRGVALELTLAYRRGGNVVEAELATRDASAMRPVDAPAVGWTLRLTGAGGAPMQWKGSASAPARAAIPRDRLCALLRDGELVASQPDSSAAGGAAQGAPVTFALAETEGRTALAEQACP